jgi:D-alanyl-D-alanine carboxypeptidase
MARRVTATTHRSVSARIFAGVSPPLDAQIPIPPSSSFNINLSSADEATMLRLLGVPGRKSDNCSPVTGTFKARIVTKDVGPFRVTGLDAAVDLLKAAFDEAAQQIPDVVAAVKTAGMLCVRHKRNNPNSFSNHSWGTAIDIFFGTDVVPQGVKKTHRGCLLLVPFFNGQGLFWGGGFTGSSVDSMHFEVSKETMQRIIHP